MRSSTTTQTKLTDTRLFLEYMYQLPAAVKPEPVCENPELAALEADLLGRLASYTQRLGRGQR